MAQIELDSEKELEDYLYEHMIYGYCPVSCEPIHQVYRQYDLGGYGVVDLVTLKQSDIDGEKHMHFNIIELKKGEIKADHIAQISRYYAGVKKYLTDKRESPIGLSFGFWLVGEKYNNNNDVMFLADNISWLTVYTYDFLLDNGINFRTGGTWERSGATLNGIEKLIKWRLEEVPEDIKEVAENVIDFQEVSEQ